tara:strand:- start:377 stop:1255 length:879 start_codon:yes stop_codon:yes gene_type:complete
MSIWNDLSWVEGIRSPFLSIFFEYVSLAGYPTFLILFVSFGYFFWSPLRFSKIAMLLFFSALINAFLKDLFQDPRPAIDLILDSKIGTSYGWPSGHTQIAVTLWGLIAYELKNKWVTAGTILIIVLIAFSRMYLGVHDLGDVIAGLVIGIIILSIWHFAISNNWYENLNKKTWGLVLFIFHLILYFLYPSHEEHELSVLLLGIMMGWFIGYSNIQIYQNVLIKFFISILSTAVVFFLLLLLTSIDNSIELTRTYDFVLKYLFGMMFSILVTWVIPRLLKLLGLASLQDYKLR